MEYVPGLTLDAYVREHGPLSNGELLALAAGLAEGIVAIHRTGIVHRDLKPSNIILSPEGPRIIDMGIGKALDDTKVTKTGMLVGTAAWLSPEQFKGEEASPAADVYAWGSSSPSPPPAASCTAQPGRTCWPSRSSPSRWTRQRCPPACERPSTPHSIRRRRTAPQRQRS